MCGWRGAFPLLIYMDLSLETQILLPRPAHTRNAGLSVSFVSVFAVFGALGDIFRVHNAESGYMGLFKNNDKVVGSRVFVSVKQNHF